MPIISTATERTRGKGDGFPAMAPYKRRRRSLIRNFWVYRRLVVLAMTLGLILWFVWANNAAVTVAFPFGLGRLNSSLGLVILLSALVGSVTTALAGTVTFAVHRARSGKEKLPAEDAGPALIDDLPPADYAYRASEVPPSHDDRT